jgi:hypothetical protein
MCHDDLAPVTQDEMATACQILEAFLHFGLAHRELVGEAVDARGPAPTSKRLEDGQPELLDLHLGGVEVVVHRSATTLPVGTSIAFVQPAYDATRRSDQGARAGSLWPLVDTTPGDPPHSRW